MRISQQAKDILASFNTDPPKGHKATAYRIMAFMEALHPTEQRRRKNKGKKGNWVPELAPLLMADKFDSSYTRTDLERELRAYVIAYQPLYNAEQEGEDCTVYWEALDNHAKPYRVLTARAQRVLPPIGNPVAAKPVDAAAAKPVNGSAVTKAAATKEAAPAIPAHAVAPAQPVAAPTLVTPQRSSIEPVVSLYQSGLAARAAQLGVSMDVMLQASAEVLLVYGTGAAVAAIPQLRPEQRRAPAPQPKPTPKQAAKKKKQAAAPITERLRAVMGGDLCTRDDVLARLKARGWYPTQPDPKIYMIQTLSRCSQPGGILERVGSGLYRVRVQDTTAEASEPQVEVEAEDADERQSRLHVLQPVEKVAV